MTEEYGLTFTELKFVYGLLLEGKDDSAILAEYARLQQEDQLEFPCRQDISFIEARKRELAAFEAARMECAPPAEHPRSLISECLVPHLESGYLDSATIFSCIKEDPADFVRILCEILQSKDIFGICPVCKDW